MDALLLSRVQCALTTYLHFLFVPLTMGLSFLIAVMGTLYVKTGDEDCLAMGPFWDGNEVWLVAAGGVTVAAFPVLYAVMFSSFYSILMLILFLLLFLLHGALWLAVNADGPLQARSIRAASVLWPFLLITEALFLMLSSFQTGLFARYLHRPVLLAIPLVAVASLIVARVWMERSAWLKAWCASCASIAGIVAFGAAGLYPWILPSSLDAAFGLTVNNSSAGPMMLKIMLGVVLALVPVIILYQGWVYRFLGGKADGGVYAKD